MSYKQDIVKEQGKVKVCTWVQWVSGPLCLLSIYFAPTTNPFWVILCCIGIGGVVLGGVYKQILQENISKNRRRMINSMLKKFNSSGDGGNFSWDDLDSGTIEEFIRSLNDIYEPDQYELISSSFDSGKIEIQKLQKPEYQLA